MVCKECEKHGWGWGHCVNPQEHATLQSIQEKSPPPLKPASLTPEMLSEEDRDGLAALRAIAIKQRSNWDFMLRCKGRDPRLAANIDQADRAIETADRLLGETN